MERFFSLNLLSLHAYITILNASPITVQDLTAYFFAGNNFLRSSLIVLDQITPISRTSSDKIHRHNC